MASPRSGACRRRCRRFGFSARAGKTPSSNGMPRSRAETWIQARAAPGPERAKASYAAVTSASILSPSCAKTRPRLVKILERPAGQQFAPFQRPLEGIVKLGWRLTDWADEKGHAELVVSKNTNELKTGAPGRFDRHRPVASPRSGACRRRCRRFGFPVRAGKTPSSNGIPHSRAETWIQARAAPGPERARAATPR